MIEIFLLKENSMSMLFRQEQYALREANVDRWFTAITEKDPPTYGSP